MLMIEEAMTNTRRLKSIPSQSQNEMRKTNGIYGETNVKSKS